jgi:glycosyltransferase involved in cell wall biosynthesis
MHDNALAKALIAQGHECLLLPIYTPIRTDEPSVGSEQVFFGGINVFLQQKMPLLGRLPRPMLKWLDAPWLIRAATRRAGSTNPALLGDLTISMLRGTEGRQAGEVRRLVRWLADDLKPDAIIMTNLLIGGCIPEIRQAMDTKILVWLQGDDIFLDHLLPRHREQAIALMRETAAQVDGCLVNSRFYAKKMGDLLEIPESKRHILPLAIPTGPFDQPLVASTRAQTSETAKGPVRIGYFARLAPEKGFHFLVDAFIELSRQIGPGNATLHYGGWLGENNREYFRLTQKRLTDAGLGRYHTHHGSPDLAEKVALMRQFDLFSVPTDYEEPKGLFVLESLASGVPVIQPSHGAFPELLASTGGGVLFEPRNAGLLAQGIQALVTNPAELQRLSVEGHGGIRARHTIEHQARGIESILQMSTP